MSWLHLAAWDFEGDFIYEDALISLAAAESSKSFKSSAYNAPVPPCCRNHTVRDFDITDMFQVRHLKPTTSNCAQCISSVTPAISRFGPHHRLYHATHLAKLESVGGCVEGSTSAHPSVRCRFPPPSSADAAPSSARCRFSRMAVSRPTRSVSFDVASCILSTRAESVATVCRNHCAHV